MTFDAVAGDLCHATTFALGESGVWTGQTIVLNQSSAVQATWRTADTAIQFAIVDGVGIVFTTETIELWEGTPSVPGSLLLYSGPITGLEAATGWKAILVYQDQFRFTYAFWHPHPDAAGGLLTNWTLCVEAADLSPPLPPLVGVSLDPAKYTLSWREFVNPDQAGNPFTRQLGDRVGVSNAELCYEDVPMLVTALGWHWVAADQPLPMVTLEVTTTVSGMPRTVASGAGSNFILGGDLGLDYGKLG